MATENIQHSMQIPDRVLWLSIRNLKILGGIQIIFGIVCTAFNIYGIQYNAGQLISIAKTVDDTSKQMYACSLYSSACGPLIRCLAYDITSFVLSSVFISIGIMPLRILVNNAESIRKKKFAFMTGSIISAVVCTVILGLSFSERKYTSAGSVTVFSITRVVSNHQISLDVIAAKIMITTAEFVVAIISTCMCKWCTCTPWPDQTEVQGQDPSQGQVFSLPTTEKISIPTEPNDTNNRGPQYPSVPIVHGGEPVYHSG